MNFLVKELIMMKFDWSFHSHYGCDCWLSVYCKTDINTSKGQ